MFVQLNCADRINKNLVGLIERLCDGDLGSIPRQDQLIDVHDKLLQINDLIFC